MKTTDHNHRKPVVKKTARMGSIPHASDTEMNKTRAKIFEQHVAAQHDHRGEKGVRADDGEAFVRVSDGTSSDEFATEMGKDFLIGAETGREVMAESADLNAIEESGGPFVITTAGGEFAEGVDASNPEDGEVAAFPTAMRKPN